MPVSPDILTCKASSYCAGVECCLTIDIKVGLLFLNGWIAVDPCKFILSVGLGKWTRNTTLVDYDWGVEKVEHLADSVVVR